MAGTAAALGFLGLLGLVFYRYSGAQWDMLGMMFFNRELIVETWPILLGGLENTLLIFICSAVLSVTIAPIIAIIRTLNNPIFNCAIDAFVDVFRSLPILVLVIFIYYALPFLEINSTPFAAGVCGLFLSALAFMIEYFRAGIESVSRGHVEAARSLGLGVIQTMRFVILPLAIRVVLPPLTGHLVGLLKATAFVSVVGMPELLKGPWKSWNGRPTPPRHHHHHVSDTASAAHVRKHAARKETREMDNTASCMIEVCDLHKHYKDVHVLRGISTTVAMVRSARSSAPRDRGKSTFLRCLNRLEEASSGEIFINAQEITDPHLNLNKMRENIGMVFQGFNLFPHMTAIQNIMLAPVNVRGLSRKEAEAYGMELLSRVGLADKHAS